MTLKSPLQVGDYVLATKWRDADPGDPWGVGFYDGFRMDRFFVIDSEGRQILPNGFRRIHKISYERGRFLLENAQTIELSRRSLGFWLRWPLKKKII